MATNKHKNAAYVAEISQFLGLDTTTPLGDDGAALKMKNFKVLPDGSLCTRDGYKILTDLGDTVRGVHAVHGAEGDFLLAVAGTMLYLISPENGVVQSAEMLGTSEGEICFFEYDGSLYLTDGAEIYRYGGGVSLAEVQGYVPLYGDGWTVDAAAGEICEPINLLSCHVRIRYRCEEGFRRLYLGVKAASVDRICNGDYLFVSSEYKLSEDGTVIDFGSAGCVPLDDTVTVCLTLDYSYWHDALLRSCKRAAKYDSFDRGRIFLYGGDDPSLLYISEPVGEASLAVAQKDYPDSGSLYFPRGSSTFFQDRQAITAVMRVRDGMMICTAGGAWMTEDLNEGDLSGEGIAIRPLSQTVGCGSLGGVLSIDGDVPVTLWSGGLVRWDLESDLARGCRVERLSDGIAACVSEKYFCGARVCYLPVSDEIWVYRPGDEKGLVFVYNTRSSCWYCYTDIFADGMLDVGGRIGFWRGREIFLFHSDLTCDYGSFGKRDIVGVFESRAMDLGDSERLKRAVRLAAEADLDGGEMWVVLKDGGLLNEVTFRADTEGVCCYDAPVGTARFRRVSLSVFAVGRGRKRLFRLCVHGRGA